MATDVDIYRPSHKSENEGFEAWLSEYDDPSNFRNNEIAKHKFHRTVVVDSGTAIFEVFSISDVRPLIVIIAWGTLMIPTLQVLDNVIGLGARRKLNNILNNLHVIQGYT